MVDGQMKKAFNICYQVGCNNLCKGRYCEKHTIVQEEKDKQYRRNEKPRRNKAFYDSKEWKRLRKMAMARDNGLCVSCLKKDRIVLAAVVDHIAEIIDAPELKLTLDNLQCLCHACHNQKTADERRKREKK